MDKNQAKDAGLALILITLLIESWTNYPYLKLVAIGLLVITMICPAVFGPFARLWFGLSHFLGTFVSKIFLTVTFFSVVTPIGLLRRVGGADSMRRKAWKNGNDSAFINRDHKFTAKDLERPY